MIDINLLPRSRRCANERRRAVRQWLVWGGLWCIALGAAQAIVVSSGAGTELAPIEREMAQLSEEESRLDGEIARFVQSIDRSQRSLAAARAVVDHPDWSVLLANIVARRPAGLEFRRWQLTPGPMRSLNLRIEGVVPTLGGLTDFALRLESLKVFRRVTIVNAQAVPATGDDASPRLVNFTIEGELLPGTPPASTTPGAKSTASIGPLQGLAPGSAGGGA
jgi:hypothetical protein